MSSRNSNLDLIRAIAISMVVVGHTMQMLGVVDVGDSRIFLLGSYGVDLFFVLSGFLVGGLYWRESFQGKVNRSRFISRRMLRTMPPYFVMLVISYVAVYMTRSEPFDFGYLVFIQNYYPVPPFFLVSWSLCVEEHFYLLLPFVLGLFLASKRILIPAALVILSFLPVIFRFIEYPGDDYSFGYHVTASHLRFDGLVLGVLAAYLSFRHAGRLQKLSNYRVGIYFLTFMYLVALAYLPDVFVYMVGYYFLALLFSACVMVAYTDKAYMLSNQSMVTKIAISSYSVYLIHSLVLHASIEIFRRIALDSLAIQIILALLLIGAAGWLFYIFVEKPTFALRRAIYR